MTVDHDQVAAALPPLMTDAYVNDDDQDDENSAHVLEACDPACVDHADGGVDPRGVHHARDASEDDEAKNNQSDAWEAWSDGDECAVIAVDDA